MDAKEKWWAKEVEKRREARRNDKGLHRRVKVKAEILDVLAKHKCTVAEVRLILSDMVSIICKYCQNVCFERLLLLLL